MVNATQNQIGSFGKQLVKSQLDAIHRRSTARPNLHTFTHIMTLFESERIDSRECTTKTRASTFWSHNQHLTPIFQKADKRLNTIGMITIIIRN